MQIIRTALLWIVGLVFVLVGINSNDPYLVPMRGMGNFLLVIASGTVVLMLLRRGGWRGRPWAGRLAVILWCMPPLALLAAHGVFEFRKQRVLRTEPVLARSLGQHFIVGYRSLDEVAPLAEKRLIGGNGVTGRNVTGRTAEALKADNRRHCRPGGARRVLPALIVATDQEEVSSSSGAAATRLPRARLLAELALDQRNAKARRSSGVSMGASWHRSVSTSILPQCSTFGRKQGAIGFDFNTLISQRAISDDPAKVSAIAGAYIQGLESAGVIATVKHFPGLGRVRADTHHFRLISIRRSANWKRVTGVRFATYCRRPAHA